MIKRFSTADEAEVQALLARLPDARYSHDPAWLRIFAETYGKKSDTFLSVDERSGKVLGMASYTEIKTPLGRKWVSLPYLDGGGPVGETPAVVGDLLRSLREAAQSQKVDLEIRSEQALPDLPQPINEKVGMVLTLPQHGSEAYWKSLDAKVRNQVRKADKSGVTVQWGREARLSDFYTVFCINMRDLGSPVHALGLFERVLKHFPGAEIGTAHREGKCIGGLFRIRWKQTLAIPWASTLREERIHSPNNALYWESIRFAFESGCTQVDFGRSSRGEGTYNFKRQWLAEEMPLCWYPFDAKGKLKETVTHASSGKMKVIADLWAKLPLPVANALGPRLRGYIPA